MSVHTYTYAGMHTCTHAHTCVHAHTQSVAPTQTYSLLTPQMLMSCSRGHSPSHPPLPVPTCAWPIHVFQRVLPQHCSSHLGLSFPAAWTPFIHVSYLCLLAPVQVGAVTPCLAQFPAAELPAHSARGPTPPALFLVSSLKLCPHTVPPSELRAPAALLSVSSLPAPSALIPVARRCTASTAMPYEQTGLHELCSSFASCCSTSLLALPLGPE